MSRPREYKRSDIIQACRRLPVEVVAQRSGYSKRHVYRIKREAGVLNRHHLSIDECGSPVEWRFWKSELELGVSKTEVAAWYLRSRPTIDDGLKKLASVDQVGGVPHSRPSHQTPSAS